MNIMEESPVMGGTWPPSLGSPSLGGVEPTPPSSGPCANSPTGVSSLISRYVSKKWLVKKGSRFTWPGGQRTRVSVKYPQASFWKETRSGGRRGCGTCIQRHGCLPRTPSESPSGLEVNGE